MKRKFDFTLLKVVAGFYAVISIITFSIRMYLSYDLMIAKSDASIIEMIFHFIILDWVLVTIIIMGIAQITKKIFINRVKIHYTIILHLLLSIAFNVILFFISLFLLLISNRVSYEGVIELINFKGFVKLFDYNFVIYFVMMGIVYVYYYLNEYKESEMKRKILHDQMTNVKANILKYQLQPHFFFNTLNSISALIDFDPKVAQKTLANFSSLLRDILYLKDTNLVTLKNEMDILNKYLDIMSIRYSGHLFIVKDIEKKLDNVLVPSLFLQPIIENCLTHGYSYNNTKLKITLTIYKKNDEIIIEVKNDGKPLDDNYKKGTGLKNTIDRLDTLYGDSYKFDFFNSTNEVVTKITIPFNT